MQAKSPSNGNQVTGICKYWNMTGINTPFAHEPVCTADSHSESLRMCYNELKGKFRTRFLVKLCSCMCVVSQLSYSTCCAVCFTFSIGGITVPTTKTSMVALNHPCINHRSLIRKHGYTYNLYTLGCVPRISCQYNALFLPISPDW